MQLWRYNGTAWALAGKTTSSNTSNYVEKTLLSDISNRWSFTDDGSVLAWNGSVSSDWNILSRDLKKITKAWAYEVAFDDGTKWKATNE